MYFKLEVKHVALSRLPLWCMYDNTAVPYLFRRYTATVLRETI